MAPNAVFPVIDDLQDWGWPDVAAIVIRHAERLPIPHARDLNYVGLTDSGVIAAEEMGRQLARYAGIRILHSPVARCEQTALALSSGARTAGSTVFEIRSERRLGGSYLIDRDSALRKADTLGTSFIREWFSGRLEPGLMLSLSESLRIHLDLMKERLGSTGLGPRLEVLVTHDWNVSVLREGFLGVRNEDVGWPEYLDGVSFVLRPTGLEARFRQRISQQDRPSC
ncbi:MAG TPA: histidine phosphatase family protein [Thermoplasmata archaeon]|jgi:hypothetical protein|nr:histidine phosphatase family protein [Thermoplasmata archaeon]